MQPFTKEQIHFLLDGIEEWYCQTFSNPIMIKRKDGAPEITSEQRKFLSEISWANFEALADRLGLHKARMDIYEKQNLTPSKAKDVLYELERIKQKNPESFDDMEIKLMEYDPIRTLMRDREGKELRVIEIGKYGTRRHKEGDGVDICFMVERVAEDNV